MRTLISALLTIVVAAFMPSGASAQSGPGTTVTIPVHARGSARAAFREALRSLRLDSVRLRSAFSDRHDRFVEGSFTATLRGTAVSGVLLAGTRGVAAAAYDTTDRAPQTVPALLARMGSAGGSAAASRPLHPVSFGTGTVALPDSWSIANSYQGCVEATSRRDHGYLAFGCPQAALAPPLLPGTDPHAVLIVAGADPVAALQRVLTSPSPAGLGVANVRIAEVQPVQAPMTGGRAAYVLFDYTAGGAPFRGLALVAVAGVGDRSYMVYKSMFMLPAATFAQLAPTLWKSWQSWGVNSGVLTSRLTAAAQSMRETGDIITGAYWARQHAGEQTSLGFDQYIRDTAQLEDVNTGRRWNGSYFDASTIVEHDPVNYRIVPIGELSR